MTALVEELKNTLQPNAIGQPGTEGGPRYALAKPEWITIQTYVNNAQALPIKDAEFRNSLGAPDDFNLDDFLRLIEAYKAIFAHTGVWRDETFPASVTIASKVYQYGSAKVPVYYPALAKLADELAEDPDNTKLQEKIKAVLESLQGTAQEFADDAKDVEDKVAQFVTETQEDKATLIGPNGDAGLKKYYNDKYGKTSKEVEELTQEIAAQQMVFDAAMKEYDHNVVVAATTPTYAWVWPFGTVAAAVVAGVYGDKAVKALDRAKAAQAKIDTLNQRLAQNARLLTYINNAGLGIDEISTALLQALPAIQEVRSAWKGMADDLGRIVDIIQKDIKEALPILMSLGIDQAMLAWENVAEAADNYRKTAFVTEPTAPAESADTFRLRVLVLGQAA